MQTSLFTNRILRSVLLHCHCICYIYFTELGRLVGHKLRTFKILPLEDSWPSLLDDELYNWIYVPTMYINKGSARGIHVTVDSLVRARTIQTLWSKLGYIAES